jgi:hypothetical protein
MTDRGLTHLATNNPEDIDSWELQQKNYFWQYFFNREKNGLDIIEKSASW